MTAESTVNDIITDARNFAAESYDAAADLINQAVSASSSSVTLTPRYINFDAPDPLETSNLGDPGEFQDGFNVPGGRPNAPTNLAALYLPELPVFPQAPEALDTTGLFDIDRPQFNIGSFSGAPPAIDTDVSLPDRPELVEYEAPETTDLQLRDTPAVDVVPRFSPQVKISDPGELGDLASSYKTRLSEALPEFVGWVDTYVDAWISKFAPEYHTAMAALEQRIADGYAGNTAVPDAVEQQMFDRVVSRAEQQRGLLDSEASERFARRGYDMPSVALNTQMAANQRAVARAVADAAREVAIERARLEHQHVQFVMQLSSSIRDSMRGQVLSYAGLLVQLNGQAIEDARQIAGLMAQVYQLLLQRSQNDMEHLRTLATVFEKELMSAMADLEIFKVEMEAAKLRKDADLADVEVWAKKIQAQETRIRLYVAELQGIAEKVGIERLKADVFGKEVDAFRALASAKESEFNAYRSAIAGDEALVRAHTEKYRGYSVEVDAARVKVQAQAAISDAGVQFNRNMIQLFDAELKAWMSELDAEGKRFDGSSEAYKTRLELFKQRLSAQIEEHRSLLETSRLDLDSRRAQTDADLRTLLAQAQLLQDRIGLIARTASAGADSYGAMAGSALSAQNTMVNLVNETVN